jgi:hypothetical protein
MISMKKVKAIVSTKSYVKLDNFSWKLKRFVYPNFPELLIVCNKYKYLFIVRNEMDVNELQLYTWSKN